MDPPPFIIVNPKKGIEATRGINIDFLNALKQGLELRNVELSRGPSYPDTVKQASETLVLPQPERPIKANLYVFYHQNQMS